MRSGERLPPFAAYKMFTLARDWSVSKIDSSVAKYCCSMLTCEPWLFFSIAMAEWRSELWKLPCGKAIDRRSSWLACTIFGRADPFAVWWFATTYLVRPIGKSTDLTRPYCRRPSLFLSTKCELVFGIFLAVVVLLSPKLNRFG